MSPQNQNPYQQQPDGQPVPQPIQPQPPANYVPQYGQVVQPLQPLPPQPGTREINPKEFEFIMNPGQAKKSLALKPGLLSNKLIMVALGLVVTIVLVLLGSSLLGGGGADEAAMLKIVQQQTEIVRIAETVKGQPSASQITKNIANSTSLVIASDKANLVSYLSKNGVKITDKQLALGKDATVDAKLTSAASTGNYDSVFQDVIKDELQTYNNTLATTYQATSGQNLKAVLSTNYNNAELLLKQLPSN